MNTRSTKKLTPDIIVVGGGAAGMMAAGTAAEAGRSVLLIEHSEKLGKKIYITGKGRCNATNRCSPEEMLRNVPHNSRFLFSSVNAFPPERAINLFEQWGCPMKTERGNRVFPVSDHSWDVIDALKRRLAYYNVDIKYDNVTKILTDEQGIIGVRTEHGVWKAPRVILATGGCSYPSTGSDGSGYSLAESVGHTVTKLTASLVPLVEKGRWSASMQGLSLKNVSIKLIDSRNKVLYEDFGELLFTHFGLSGPVILSVSAHRDGMGGDRIEIDLKPALDEQKLENRLLREFSENPNRELAGVIGGMLPRSMVPVFLERCSLSGRMKNNSITKEQRKAILYLLKHFDIEIEGSRPIEEAIVTSGGISVREINPKTMESKILRGLYFAGEIIDVDAYTGGFNLQIAWATGYCAGKASAES